ncbi:MAG: putative transposase [Rhodospirillales bacterium]|jgi:transposase InsO family protein|nr:putative transposase [Rhodospirillales bacterium]
MRRRRLVPEGDDRRSAIVLARIDARLSPAIDVRQNYRGADVVATLERVARELVYPKTIRLDNGPEFISKELDLWAFMRGVTLDFSRPGKPTDNAFIETDAPVGLLKRSRPSLPLTTRALIAAAMLVSRFRL